MEEDYSEYILQPGDIPLGKKAAIISGVKQALAVLLLFGCFVFLSSDFYLVQSFLSGCGLVMISAILWGSLNGIMVTDVLGNNHIREKYTGNVKVAYSQYEWDDELFNEIMSQFGAVFGEMNLEQFVKLYKPDDDREDDEPQFRISPDLSANPHIAAKIILIDDEHFNIEIEALFKAIDTDNNGMVSLENIKQGCSRGYENGYPHQFYIGLIEKHGTDNG